MKPFTIEEFMTPNPTCIDASATVIEAYRKMQSTECRHLPVLQNGQLVGIVSQRGLYRLETLVNIDRAQSPVLDAMDVPFVVLPEKPLLEVVQEMATRKVGGCVVAKSGKVIGVFTTNDALTALVDLLSTRAETGKRSAAGGLAAGR